MTMNTHKFAEFKRTNPEQVQAYIEEGAAMERDRWRGIEAVAKELGPRHATLIKAMKADGRCTGGDLAQAALAISRPSKPQAAVSVDHVAVQRKADEEWNADSNLRAAFQNNQQMYVKYRVALAMAA